jgi:hypothetical protein
MAFTPPGVVADHRRGAELRVVSAVSRRCHAEFSAVQGASGEGAISRNLYPLD